MNDKVLKTLEYNKIIEKLTDYACSDEAKARCRSLRPSTDLAEINLLRHRQKMP